jgi:hypothetical protein
MPAKERFNGVILFGYDKPANCLKDQELREKWVIYACNRF